MKPEHRKGMRFLVQGLSEEELARVNGGTLSLLGINCTGFSCSVNKKNCFDEYCSDVSCRELY